MAKYTSFEHFARDVFLCDSYFYIPFMDENKLVPTHFVDDAAFVIDAFADAHCEYFRSVFLKHEYDTFKTDEDLFKFAIPRCLGLIDEDRYYYSMMLVASFLKELVTFLRDTRVCYRFHFTVYKCFAAVYERFFKISFELERGWYGLQDFLLETIHDLKVSKEKIILSTLNNSDRFMCSKVAKLIENCDNCNEFYLNDYESTLLRDRDLKDIEESLDYTENEDPLNMIWPLNDEDVIKISNSLSDLDLKEILTDSIDRIYMNSYHHYDETSTETVSKFLVIPSAEEDGEVSCKLPNSADTVPEHPTYPDRSSPEHLTDDDSGKDSEGSNEPITDSDVGSGSEGYLVTDSGDKIGSEDIEHRDPNWRRASEPLADCGSSSEGSPEPPNGHETRSNQSVSSEPFTGLDSEYDSECSHDPENRKDVGNTTSGSVPEGNECNNMPMGNNPDSFSVLEVYTPKLEAEARTRLGTEKFLENFKLRLCPCCGIKCCQFSLQLSLKQIDIAFT